MGRALARGSSLWENPQAARRVMGRPYAGMRKPEVSELFGRWRLTKRDNSG